MSHEKLSYADAGVNIDLGNELAQKYLSLMHRTFNKNVPRHDNGFGGLYGLRDWMPASANSSAASDGDEPILVSGTDGVGTKLKIAFALGKHDTVGIDLVAMSVNDVLVQGARPLFFLDYIGSGKCDRATMLALVEGVSTGCLQAGCALLGGETAEMPGFYPAGEYDLAGFAVGIVARKNLIDGKKIRVGDKIIGLASSGLHSNGYSLARKALLEIGGLRLDENIPELGITLGEELLTPTRIYVKNGLALLAKFGDAIRGLVHITGGGLIENTPRILPQGCGARFNTGTWKVPPVFNLIQKCGNIEDIEMYRVFNMGVGMLLVAAPDRAAEILAAANELGETAHSIGEIVVGGGVNIELN
ncbi:phosphoribosylformylglycinamidine cyclo-ligase [Planctomycetales bacterium]|nr:phosphoribosylformylglycinamidine cyclo-ligase [Planctomycetales bacterium]